MMMKIQIDSTVYELSKSEEDHIRTLEDSRLQEDSSKTINIRQHSTYIRSYWSTRQHKTLREALWIMMIS